MSVFELYPHQAARESIAGIKQKNIESKRSKPYIDITPMPPNGS
jgi:hypothetical protein